MPPSHIAPIGDRVERAQDAANGFRLAPSQSLRQSLREMEHQWHRAGADLDAVLELLDQDGAVDAVVRMDEGVQQRLT